MCRTVLFGDHIHGMCRKRQRKKPTPTSCWQGLRRTNSKSLSPGCRRFAYVVAGVWSWVGVVHIVYVHNACMQRPLMRQKHMDVTIRDYEAKLERRRIGAEQHSQILEVTTARCVFGCSELVPAMAWRGCGAAPR